jgi:hypothetical protein
MPIPAFRQDEPEPPAQSSLQTSVQTIAGVVTALAAVVAQFTSHNRVVWAVALASAAIVVVAGGLGNRLVARLRQWKAKSSRNKVARGQHAELMRFVTRFAQFADAQNQSNIRQIIFTFGGNNEERCREIFPPDYMNGVVPLFVKSLETRPPTNAREFLLALEQLHALIASYNDNYVLEPFRRMRAKRWRLPPTMDAKLGITRPADPSLGTWFETLPPTFPEAARPKIKDFRERWVRFLDDTTQWIDRVGEELGQPLPSYFERPQEL